MAGVKSSMVVFMVMMVAAMQIHDSIAQTTHVVGGSLGWTIPPAGAYATWASQQNFSVGDSLLFNFTTGLHNVAEVSQAAYGPCTTTNPISLTTAGPATLRLATAGTHYYICTVGTHCQIGQKLTINVVAAAAAPTTPPAAAPTSPPPAATPTVSPPTATPTPTPTPTPPPVSPPTTTPTPAPGPSTTAPPTPSPAPSSAESSPPSPSAPGASPPGSSISPAGDTTPTPPSPSTAARSFTAVLPVTFFAVVVAFFY